MNRAQLRFLGFQHDTLSHQAGTQAERDRLLATIDRMAEDRRRVAQKRDRQGLTYRSVGAP